MRGVLWIIVGLKDDFWDVKIVEIDRALQFASQDFCIELSIQSFFDFARKANPTSSPFLPQTSSLASRNSRLWFGLVSPTHILSHLNSRSWKELHLTKWHASNHRWSIWRVLLPILNVLFFAFLKALASFSSLWRRIPSISVLGRLCLGWHRCYEIVWPPFWRVQLSSPCLNAKIRAKIRFCRSSNRRRSSWSWFLFETIRFLDTLANSTDCETVLAGFFFNIFQRQALFPQSHNLDTKILSR